MSGIDEVWIKHGPSADSGSKFSISKLDLLHCIQSVLEHPVEVITRPYYKCYYGINNKNLGRVLTPQGFRCTRLIEIRVNLDDGKILDAFLYLLGFQLESS